MSKFIHLRLGSYIIMHGYDEQNNPLEEEHTTEDFTAKLVAIDRIQSVTEKYILIGSSHGRVIYWEYEGTLGDIESKLREENLLI